MPNTGDVITVHHRQTLWDLAVQHYGDVSGVFQLMKDNPDKISNLDTAIAPGTKLRISGDPAKTDTKGFFKANKLFPVTADEEFTVGGGDYNLDYSNDYLK